MDKRLLTLFGSHVLFAAVSLAILLKPDLGPAVYPFYGLIFLWSSLRGDEESPVIFLFLVTVAGVLMAAWACPPGQRPAAFLEIAGLWLLHWGLELHRGRRESDSRELAGEQSELEARVRDEEREIEYYRAYQQSVDGQIRLRRDLTESARSLGSTLDGREVHIRLVDALRARYPAARVAIAAAAGSDALAGLSAREQGPVLVNDASSDSRLSSARGLDFRSGLAVPMRVMKAAAGFVKLEAERPGAFSAADVRTVDLFATMASLSLENIQFYESVKQLAVHDQLTQLFSHKAFQTRLKEELLRAGRSQSPLSFILLDVDHFKKYNDRYGHQAGDELLRRVASILTSFARPVDFAARYGGEEFCLILPNFVRTEAVDLANRIRLRVASEPFVFQGQSTSATVSVGVSSFPQDATTASQIVRMADERLYRAKDGGRNQVVG